MLVACEQQPLSGQLLHVTLHPLLQWLSQMHHLPCAVRCQTGFVSTQGHGAPEEDHYGRGLTHAHSAVHAWRS